MGDEHAVGAGSGDPPQRDERLVRTVSRGAEGQRDLATGLAQPSGDVEECVEPGLVMGHVEGRR